LYPTTQNIQTPQIKNSISHEFLSERLSSFWIDVVNGQRLKIHRKLYLQWVGMLSKAKEVDQKRGAHVSNDIPLCSLRSFVAAMRNCYPFLMHNMLIVLPAKIFIPIFRL
jgi:hypothetical protein